MHSNEDSDRITEFTEGASRVADKLHGMGVPQKDVDEALETMSERFVEFTLHGVTEDEHSSVGDSVTAQQIHELRLYMEAKFADINQHIDHIVSHDRLTPTPGCTYCEVRHAA